MSTPTSFGEDKTSAGPCVVAWAKSIRDPNVARVLGFGEISSIVLVWWECALGDSISSLMPCSDDPYSLEQLKAPRMNLSVVRPLVDSLYETQDLSIGGTPVS